MPFARAFLPAVLFLFLNVSLYAGQSSAARILSISFLSTKSHKITYEPLLQALAKRGHSLTVLSPIPSKEGPNLRNIQALTTEQLEAAMKMPNIFEMKTSAKSGLFASLLHSVVGSVINPFLFLGPMVERVCQESYELPQVQAIMKEKFDLILFPPIFNECLYGLVHRMNTTSILIAQTALTPWVASSFGVPSPPAFVPLAIRGFSDDMTFRERCLNFFTYVNIWASQTFIYHPRVEALYRNLLGADLPSILEIERNASLILTNSHISYIKPRPLMADTIEVGGMALTSAQPVPKELDEFLSGNGEDGFIYFSMGSAMKGSDMPENYRKLFLNTFAKLKQRVIWKWETETMDDLPKNVKLSKWLPQQDILGHKNMRAFITHGGHGSTQEAMFHGVPLVGLAMMADQTFNLETASRLGFAIPLEFTELTEEVLLQALSKVMSDSSYREKAQEISAVFQDQMNKPLERAVYWTEYVLRHKGALHLRSAGRNLTFVQYYSLDVMGFFLFLALLTLAINLLLIRAIFRTCCCRGKNTSKVPASKKRN